LSAAEDAVLLWQSVHWRRVMPRAAACQDARHERLAIPPWHWAQENGTFSRCTRDLASAAGRMSWLPWQELQVAAFSPSATPRAWTPAS
jgi:hypothetical protein